MSYLFRSTHALLFVLGFIVIATGQQSAKQYVR